MLTNQPIWLANLTADERRALRPGVPDPLPARPDVLVVGGGVVGLAVAHFLALRRSGSILVVEADALASGASGANAGGIFPGQQGAHLPPAFRELGLASRGLYAEMSGQDWADFDWRQTGSLALPSERFTEPLGDYAAAEKARGRRVEYVSGPALRELEPALAPELDEGIYYPEDGRLNPVCTALSFARSATAAGASIATGVRVEGVEVEAGRLRRLRTTAGAIEPGTAVLSTGWAVPQLAESLGLRLPVEPANGQMMATGPTAGRIRTNVSSTLVVMQLPTGEVLTGGTVEYVGADCEPTSKATDHIAVEARRVFPFLRDVPFQRAWAGLRPHTPDDLPVIDRAPGLENVWLAAGHFKNGVLLAPITGRLIAEWIVDGEPSMDLTPLRAGRF
jgi:glycine/D-amino acid oxidase-like deaminating enzyme